MANQLNLPSPDVSIVSDKTFQARGINGYAAGGPSESDDRNASGNAPESLDKAEAKEAPPSKRLHSVLLSCDRTYDKSDVRLPLKQLFPFDCVGQSHRAQRIGPVLLLETLKNDSSHAARDNNA